MPAIVNTSGGHGTGDAWPEDGTVLQLPPLARGGVTYARHDNIATAPAGARNSADGTTVLVIHQGQAGVPVVVANPLAWNRTEIVTVRVNSTSPHVVVVDEDMRSVSAQLAPPEPWNTSNTGPGGHTQRHVAWAVWAAKAAASKQTGSGPEVHHHLSRLVFAATLPALGVARFFVVGALPGQAGAAAISDVVAVNKSAACISTSGSSGGAGGGGGESSPPVITLGNRDQTLIVDGCTGLIDSVTSVRSGASLELRQDLMLYWGNGGLDGPGSAPDGTLMSEPPILLHGQCDLLVVCLLASLGSSKIDVRCDASFGVLSIGYLLVEVLA